MAKLSATLLALVSLATLLLAAFFPAMADGPDYDKPRGYQERYSGCQSGPFAGTYIGAAAGLNWTGSDFRSYSDHVAPGLNDAFDPSKIR